MATINASLKYKGSNTLTGSIGHIQDQHISVDSNSAAWNNANFVNFRNWVASSINTQLPEGWEIDEATLVIHWKRDS